MMAGDFVECPTCGSIVSKKETKENGLCSVCRLILESLGVKHAN